MEISDFWTVHDYIQRMVAWLSVDMTKQLCNIADTPPDMRGYRIRLEFAHSEHITSPVLVNSRKKLIIISFDRANYKSKNPLDDIARVLMDAMFEIGPNADANLVNMLYEGDQLLKDNLSVLYDNAPIFVKAGVTSAIWENKFDHSKAADAKLAAEFMDETLDRSDMKADFLS